MKRPLPTSGKPWFREPWPWLLASGPLLVVIASLVSAWIAIKSSDGLVSDDYYRQGLAAQETISRSDKAVKLGLSAKLNVSAESLKVHLSANDPGYVLPKELRVTLSHPTRAGLDQTLSIPLAGTHYAGRFHLPAAGHWLILIEDDVKSWRVMGSIVLPANGEIAIGEASQAERQSP